MQKHYQTRQRQLLLELISEVKGHIDAKELFVLASARDHTISQATVYRSLNLFKRQGLIDEKNLGHAHCFYELKGEARHQHLVCRRCGQVIEFDCPLDEIIESVKQRQGFIVTRAEVYLEGECEICARKSEKGSDQAGGFHGNN